MSLLEEASAIDALFPAVEMDDHLFPDYFDDSDSESDNPDCVNAEELENLGL